MVISLTQETERPLQSVNYFYKSIWILTALFITIPLGLTAIIVGTQNRNDPCQKDFGLDVSFMSVHLQIYGYITIINYSAMILLTVITKYSSMPEIIVSSQIAILVGYGFFDMLWTIITAIILFTGTTDCIALYNTGLAIFVIKCFVYSIILLAYGI